MSLGMDESPSVMDSHPQKAVSVYRAASPFRLEQEVRQKKSLIHEDSLEKKEPYAFLKEEKWEKEKRLNQL